MSFFEIGLPLAGSQGGTPAEGASGEPVVAARS
jgi:hypothetical protein